MTFEFKCPAPQCWFHVVAPWVFPSSVSYRISILKDRTIQQCVLTKVLWGQTAWPSVLNRSCFICVTPQSHPIFPSLGLLIYKIIMLSLPSLRLWPVEAVWITNDITLMGYLISYLKQFYNWFSLVFNNLRKPVRHYQCEPHFSPVGYCPHFSYRHAAHDLSSRPPSPQSIHHYGFSE